MTHKMIIKRIIGDSWTPKDTFQKLQTEYGYLPASVDRRLRELAEDREIETKEINGLAHYRRNQPKEELIGFN